MEAQKLKALGIRNRIEAEIGDAAAAAAAAAAVLPVVPVDDCVCGRAESRKQKVSEAKQQIAEEEEEVPLLQLLV